MKKILLVIIFSISLYMYVQGDFSVFGLSSNIAIPETKDVHINGDHIIASDKDIKLFKDAEDHVIKWFSKYGYNKNFNVEIEFVDNIAEYFNRETFEGERVMGSFVIPQNKIYVTHWYKYSTAFGKFGASEKDLIKGTLIHELAHYYLYNHGVMVNSFVGLGVHETIASIVEIDSYPIAVKREVLIYANESILEMKLESNHDIISYLLMGINYIENFYDFQTISYWAYVNLDDNYIKNIINIAKVEYTRNKK